ncbi:transmembrane protein 185A-like [Ctenocephalides felis]|uniref:transmembrane protein 185A-like n=1 Tax=Ctenocephalides felis TaxID=7515 RepID=UPI000E6E5268|nr:transmembrane protein 185A-like [Ctenocephalides felis]
MNLQSIFQDFNPSKFIVHSSLLTFVVLFALRLDDWIDWSYWAIFSPLWIWKGFAISGALVGGYVWWRYPHYRLEGDSYAHFKAMLISLALHLILLMFELLACDKLHSGRHLWVLVFIPLIFVSVVSVAACVWAVKHDRSFELELFCSVNALQFVFLPLKLDGFVSWSWEVVFVPLWIVLCLSLVGVLYSIIFCGILLRTPEISSQQSRSAMFTAIGHCFTVLPILVFQVLLADKLDGGLKWPFCVVITPLILALFTLILLSFGSKGGNKWWFGIRKDFCQFLLSTCPILQEYANIAYHSDNRSDREDGSKNERKMDKRLKKSEIMKPVVPIVSIEMPD